MASEGLITCCSVALLGRRLAFCGGMKLRRLEEDCELCLIFGREGRSLFFIFNFDFILFLFFIFQIKNQIYMVR